MKRVHIELVPAIARSLVGLGTTLAFGGAHGLRRLAEGLIWSEPPYPRRECGACPQVRHHYRYHCQPRCYDCRR